MKKVVITDHVYPSLDYEKKMLKEVGAELVETKGTGEEEIISAVKDADAVITCFAEITERVILSMEKCKSISRTGIGVNNVDIQAATQKGIKVMNVPDYCIQEVSDHAMAFLLSLAKKIPALNNAVKNGCWSFEEQRPINRLSEQTLGLVGFGRIARLVAAKALPFGLKVIAYDPFISEETMLLNNAAKVSLEELYQQSDYISLHLPLTKDTVQMIAEKALNIMKPTASIINTSRGALIDEKALYEALKSKKIAAAALDVLSNEDYDPQNPLFSLENIIFTPHSGFYSVEATQELREKIISDLLAVLAGKEPKYLVN